jgi:translation initiation factor IF-3
MDYPEIGRNLLDTIEEELNDVSITEQKPKMEGRRMMLILAPNR